MDVGGMRRKGGSQYKLTSASYNPQMQINPAVEPIDEFCIPRTQAGSLHKDREQ
jgi:hypothetical protein